MKEDPIHRKWHHAALSFGLVYAFDEHFVLPLSHDEVVHGKGSLLQRMPGDDWQRFANLRAYLGFMWGHPGKKLLFMGQEFGQPDEWNYDAELPWGLLDDRRHAAVQRWVSALNTAYRQQGALHRRDGDRAAFEWLRQGGDGVPLFAWIRRGHEGDAPVMVVSHFGGEPLEASLPTLGLPWRVLLDSGAAEGREAGVTLQDDQLSLRLPPFHSLYLVAER
jgi:1,4-alpha-glucan branching enzyme